MNDAPDLQGASALHVYLKYLYQVFDTERALFMILLLLSMRDDESKSVRTSIPNALL